MFTPYQRYFDFQGRSSRSEFWLFVLLTLILQVGAIAVDMAIFGTNPLLPLGMYGPAYVVLMGANIIPSLSVQVRRLHDTNRSGWWMLIALIPLIGALVLLIFNCLASTDGANRFGLPHRVNPEDLQETFA